MATWRNLATLAIVLTGAAGARAQTTYSLTEKPLAGDCYRVRLAMKLTGAWHVQREEKTVPVKLEAGAAHEFAERVLAVGPGDAPATSARYYTLARASITSGGHTTERVLPPERRLIVAQHHKDQFVTYCPEGPLTRDELETLEHFDSLHLAGLLPQKAVAQGETWKLANPVAQALCGFDGLIEQNLACKLARVEGDEAKIAVSGTASGICLGAMARLTVDATAVYHLKQKRVIGLEWKQGDVRDQGPASPAATVEASWTLSRTFLDEEPKEISDPALIPLKIADGAEVSEGNLLLVHRDAKHAYQLTYERDWHTAGVTPEHLILRLMDRGDWVAQATITPWTKAEPGKHLSADAFKEAMDETPGWEAAEIQEDGEMPAKEGYWVYRVSAVGEMDGLKVVQNFFLVAGPQGDQVVVAVTLRPAMVQKLGTRDLKLVDGIDLGVKGK